MTIVNISTALIKDPDLFQDYVSKAAVLLKEHGVEVVCRGKYLSSPSGHEASPHIMAMFRYKDMAAVRRFYECAEYQPLVSLRDAACSMTIQLYEE